MTIFQVPNYGSVLQTFASQLFFEKLGYSCEIINYKYPNSWHYNNGAIRSNRSVLIKVLKWLFKTFGIRENDRFLKRINAFRKANLNFTPLFVSLESLSDHDWKDYECVIAGSDQIWNHRFVLGDSAFMLSFVPDGIKKLSLASSFASDHIPDNLVEKYRSNLSRFLFLGVREENGISIIREQLGLSVAHEVILDPTLLISKKEWIDRLQLSSFGRRDPYILLYILDYAFDPYPYILEVANYFSKKMKMPIKVVSGNRNQLKTHLPEYDDCMASSPCEFVDLIRQAKLVITSSFHGTAFSINFERPLITVISPNGDDRQKSLLERLGIESCKAHNGQSIETINPYYNYKKSSEILSSIRAKQYCLYEQLLQ